MHLVVEGVHVISELDGSIWAMDFLVEEDGGPNPGKSTQ